MSLREIQESIIGEFARLDDWLEKYEYLVQQGNALVPPENSIRTDGNALQGCQSQVWIGAREENGRVFFLADSDSAIVRGILVLLLRALDGRSPGEIATADLYFMKEIGISTHLSPLRANGVALIVQRMRDLGRACAI